MTERTLPRYPVYVPSKGRSENPLTIRFLQRDECPFRVVVEPEERKAYAALVEADQLLVLPKNDGGLIYARNWIKAHSIEEGHERHWQLDDNIGRVRRMYRGKRIPCRSGVALRVVEDFTDRYENVALSGLNYEMFVTPRTRPPFVKNAHVYSCTLVNNAIPHRWRLARNDDTDLCLQVLADGWCTILVNAFMVQKARTMTMSGGNTDSLYQGDGRLKMSRDLERMWPGVALTDRRYGRPAHVIRGHWKRFDTPLKLKPDVVLEDLPPEDEYGMIVTAAREVRAPGLRRLLDG